MTLIRRYLPWTGLLLAGVCMSAWSHDDMVGARFVDPDGVNAADCRSHHEPCRSIQFALAKAEPGNTVKVAAGVYDMSDVDPESFLFGARHAQGGYSEEGHYEVQDPDANPTILVGVDRRYRQQLMHQGFKWAANEAAGRLGFVDESPAPAMQATAMVAVNCVQGLAGQFPCRNVDFQAQIALNQFTSSPNSAANVWGLVDLNDNREYAVIGLNNGTSIVEVTDPVNPRQVDFVPGNNSSWREVKIYQRFDAAANRYRAYAYITTEATNSGLQVIDLSGLPNSVALASTIADTGRQHTDYVSNIDYSTNLVLPGATAYLYVAGSNIGGGSWRVYSLANAAQPQFIRQAPGAGYMHDSTSMLITDARTAQCMPGHSPCEVFVDFNEDTVDLWDVTDKASPVRLSSTTYNDVAFTHSGWPTMDQRRIFVHDELEEIRRGLFTQIYTMNVDDLRNPFIQASYQGPDTTTDHNGYTKGNLLYVSHYRRGLAVFDASNPAQLRVVGSFDTFLTPATNSAGFDGAWGVYPFFPSGTVVISDINNGLFVLRDHTATLSQRAGQIGFVGLTATVDESAGAAQVRVRRNVGSAGAVSIQYATSDGTATVGGDYTAANGTLNWAPGNIDELVINVPLVSDAVSEGNETFRMTLSGATGGAVIEGSTTLDVTISNGAVVGPPGAGNGGGGGGAVGIELLGLLSLLIFSAGGKPRACRRADQCTDQVRLRHDSPAQPA